MQVIRSRIVAGQAAALAQAGTDRMHAAAVAEAARLREEGRQAGLAEAQARISAAERQAGEAGRRADEQIAKARADAEDRLGRVATALEHAIAGISGLEHQLVQNSEAELVRLALAVAARVLAREVDADPAWMRTLIESALAEVPDRRRVAVRCAPRDAAAIRERLAATAAAVPGTERLELEEDPALQPGALVLAAQGTRLDASVSTSWERIARALVSQVPRPPLAMRDDGTPPPERQP
jgi:flagellar assembly protein FliH